HRPGNLPTLGLDHSPVLAPGSFFNRSLGALPSNSHTFSLDRLILNKRIISPGPPIHSQAWRSRATILPLIILAAPLLSVPPRANHGDEGCVPLSYSLWSYLSQVASDMHIIKTIMVIH